MTLRAGLKGTRATPKDPDYIRHTHADGSFVDARGNVRGRMRNKVLQPSRGHASRATFRKSGAPKDYKVHGKGFVTICLSMPPGVFRKLVEVAARENKNRSQLVRDLVEAHHATFPWKTP